MSLPDRLPPSSPEAAFEAAFRAHAAELCDFACAYVQSRDAAAELVQDVFFRLWSHRETLTEITNLRVYLFAATRNAALDALRHHRIERRWRERTQADAGPLPASRPADAHDAVEAGELNAAIERAVERLPERARQAFVLRWRNHLSNAEIGEVMNLSVKAVEIYRARAHKHLRKALAKWIE